MQRRIFYVLFFPVIYFFVAVLSFILFLSLSLSRNKQCLAVRIRNRVHVRARALQTTE